MFKFLKDKLKSALAKITKKVEEEAPEEVIEQVVEQPKATKKPKVEKPSKPKKEAKPKKEKKSKKEPVVVEEPAAEVKEELVQEAEAPHVEQVAPEVQPEEQPAEKKGFFSRLFKKKEEAAEEITAPEEKPKGKPEPVSAVEEVVEEKKGFFGKLKEKIVTKRITIDKFAELFWELEVVMLENNVAVAVIDRIKTELQHRLVDKPLQRGQIEAIIQKSLKESIEQVLKIPTIDVVGAIKKKTDKPYVIVFVGVNGAGKCISGDSEIQLTDGSVMRIDKLYQKALLSQKPIKDGPDNIIMNPSIEIPSLNPTTLKMENKKVSAIWQLKSTEFLYKIVLANGKEITTTPEHPFFTLRDGFLSNIRSDHLQEGSYVAVSRTAPLGNYNQNLLERLHNSFFIGVKNIEEFYHFLETKYGSILGAYQHLEIKQSQDTFAYYWRKKKILPLHLYLKFKSMLIPVSLQYARAKPIPLISFSQELAELVGLLLAEGHMDTRMLEVTNKDVNIIHRFELLAKKTFNLTAKTFTGTRGLIRSRISSATVVRFFNSVFEVPIGNKSTILKVPEIILKSDRKKVISFLRAYIEAEGHIGFKSRSLEISTASYDAARGLCYLFTKLGILTTLSKRKYKQFSSYRVYVVGHDKFNQLSELGLYTPKNIHKLKISQSANHQFELTELIPHTGPLIRKLRFIHSKYQKDLSKITNTSRSLISMYESRVPIPRKNMQLLSQVLHSRHLHLLATSDLSWIKVQSVKKIKAKSKWVYDLTIDDTHNFIANGVVIHNTTTLARVAHLLKSKGLRVVLAAADTFRAGAKEQLLEWGKRLDLKVISHDYGADPAAVCFDSLTYAKKTEADVVLIDTAGRQHSNVNLVEQMKKIVRVAKPDLKLFIGESIAGNDVCEQADQFNKSIGIDGIILTKADIDDKGGAMISVSYVTGKPILYLGVGQNLEDLAVFDPANVLKTLGL